MERLSFSFSGVIPARAHDFMKNGFSEIARFSRFSLTAFVLASASIILPSAAMAQSSGSVVNERLLGGHTILGASKDWTAISYRDEEGRIWCAAYTMAQNADTVRGDRSLFLSYPAGDAASIFMTAMTGRSGSEGIVVRGLIIDGGPAFDLFLDGDRMFNFPEDDRSVVAAIRRGKQASVDAPGVADKFSLMGATRTLSVLDESCARKQDDGFSG